MQQDQRAYQQQHTEEKKRPQHSGQPRMPFAHEILMAADAAAEPAFTSSATSFPSFRVLAGARVTGAPQWTLFGSE